MGAQCETIFQGKREGPTMKIQTDEWYAKRSLAGELARYRRVRKVRLQIHATLKGLRLTNLDDIAKRKRD
ncbi:MAG: hypothetical protein ACYCQJ_12855 [Nitrososphaerales archaeon]